MLESLVFIEYCSEGIPNQASEANSLLGIVRDVEKPGSSKYFFLHSEFFYWTFFLDDCLVPNKLIDNFQLIADPIHTFYIFLDHFSSALVPFYSFVVHLFLNFVRCCGGFNVWSSTLFQYIHYFIFVFLEPFSAIHFYL